MNFLEAMKVLKEFSSEHTEDFLFAMSGTPSQIVTYLRAVFAKNEIKADITTIPFGTLGQYSFSGEFKDGDIVLLTSMDLVPLADWRSGFVDDQAGAATLLEEASALIQRLSSRPGVALFYLPAPLLPIFSSDTVQRSFEADLVKLMRDAGASVMPDGMFSLSTYLTTGSPIGGAKLSQVAEFIWAHRSVKPAGSSKVLVTDLDNVMWSGVVAEDGVEGIQCQPQGTGYIHHIYQGFLKVLKSRGVLIAAVSRNDPEIAAAPFDAKDMVLVREDMVALVASYNAKSSQIEVLAAQLNLGLDSFVFVDDNPLEIAEVEVALPQVTCVLFPDSVDDFPAFVDDVSRMFRRDNITDEDRSRSELYKRRVEGMAPSDVQGADLSKFLQGLRMTVELHERSEDNFERAVQLINKTTQFNLNGRSFDDGDIAKILANGGRLLTGTLKDRTGSHGEVICCLLDHDGLVLSWVMSCRVFQRRLEHAFLSWLTDQVSQPLRFAFSKTERNEPIAMFFDDPAFKPGSEGEYEMNTQAFLKEHAKSIALIEIVAS